MIRHIPNLIAHVTQEIRNFTDIAVVGMSGGADSTLVAILASLALGSDKVYSLHMPATVYDTEKFNKNSLAVASSLKLHQLVLPIGDLAESLSDRIRKGLGVTSLSRLNFGNSRARLRMACLYGVSHHLAESHKQRVRVLGTGNLSEDYIGYDTKGGDALADIFPIGELFKSEVYQLLDNFALQGLISEEMIDRIPSAGLWEGQSDEGELGYSYGQMEPAIRKALQGLAEQSLEQASEIERFVWQRHAQHKHKHEAPSVVALRQFCD